MTEKPRTIPILADIPNPDPRFGFENYVDGIAAAVMGGDPPRYTIGLYGPWGSGKSSLLSALASSLRKGSGDKNPPIVVEFDAWRYESSGQLLLPLLLTIKNKIEEKSSQHDWKAALYKMANVVKSFEISFFGAVTLGSNGNVGGGSSSENYLMPFESLRGLSNSLESEQRIVVLVDDLDRCAPERVVDVLEAIHILTDVTGFVFVMALDYEYLTAAIDAKYKNQNIDADRYIEKIVQVPFHIPRMSEVGDHIDDMIPNWKKLRKEDWLSGVTEKKLAPILEYGMRSNPRQVKRLINTTLLARHMTWNDDD